MPMLIIAVITGSAAITNFNFKTLKFEPFWQSMLFIAVFVISIVIMFKRK
jgi:hypothetical protein